MNYIDSLMEMVIEEDSIEEYKDRLDEIALQESLLSKIGLSKEDLQNPNKVKEAIKNLNGITSEYEKRSTYINMISSLLQTISSLLSLVDKFPKGKLIAILSNFVIQMITSIANYHLGVSDYRKLLNKIDTQISKTSKRIEKLNKDDKDHKDEIKQLEEIRNNLKKSKGEVMKRMREENKIEGKEEEINPEAQHPMAAFTGMIK